MDSIEQMTRGWWRPSPGSIYPMLESLQSEGLIKKRDDGRYELTQQSREEMEGIPGFGGARTRTLEGMLDEIRGYVSYFEDLSKTDGSKISNQREQIRLIAERLGALVREGGEKA